MSSPVKVQIFGQTYTIHGELDPAYVQKLAAYVDEKMSAIADATSTSIRMKIAVLAALSIADELHSTQRDLGENDELAARASRALPDAGRARVEADGVRRGGLASHRNVATTACQAQKLTYPQCRSARNSCSIYWLHLVGVRSQRCLRSSAWSWAGSGPLSLAARLASTCWRLRMPGMMVLTSLLLRMKRRAISGMVMPSGSSGFSASACSTLVFRFSGDEIGVAPIALRAICCRA